MSDKNTALQDKLRVLLACSRECLALKDETDCLSDTQFDELWNDLESVENILTSLKAECLI